MTVTLEADELLENAIRDGIRKGVMDKFTSSYHNPLDKIIQSAVETHSGTFRSMLEDAIGSIVGEESFREEIANSVRSKLAKVLVQRFGGELEKQVNVLKSDPTTRARITVAIEDIVKSTKT